MKKRQLFYTIECLLCGALTVTVCAATHYLIPYFSAAWAVRLLVVLTCVLFAVGGHFCGFFVAKRAAITKAKGEEKEGNRGALSNRAAFFSAWNKPYFLLAASALYLAAAAFLGKYLSAGVAILLTYFLKGGILPVGAICLCVLLFAPVCFMLSAAASMLACKGKEEGVTVSFFPLFGGVGIALGGLLFSGVLSGSNPTGVLLGTALLLLALYAAKFLAQGERLLRQSVALVLFFVCAAGSGSIPYCFINDEFLAAEIHSAHGYYKIEDRGNAVTLSHFAIEGANLEKRKNVAYHSGYATRALAALFMAEEADRALCIGVGTGAFATECVAAFPSCFLTVCEKDDALLSAVKTHFGLPEEVLAVRAEGRTHLAKTDGLYDVIFIDEYRSLTLPRGYAGVEFFRLAQSRLSAGGVVALHVPAYNSAFPQGVIAAAAEVFSTLYAVVEGEDAVVFASNLPNLSARLSAALYQEEREDALVSAMQEVEVMLAPCKITAAPLTDKSAGRLSLELSRLEEMVAPTYAAYRKKLKTEGFWELFS